MFVCVATALEIDQVSEQELRLFLLFQCFQLLNSTLEDGLWIE